MPETEVFLPTSGGLPGIPGTHAPGMYLVDYEARTIRPVPGVVNTDQLAPLPTLAGVNVEQLAAQMAEIEQELKTIEQPA